MLEAVFTMVSSPISAATLMVLCAITTLPAPSEARRLTAARGCTSVAIANRFSMARANWRCRIALLPMPIASCCDSRVATSSSVPMTGKPRTRVPCIRGSSSTNPAIRRRPSDARTISHTTMPCPLAPKTTISRSAAMHGWRRRGRVRASEFRGGLVTRLADAFAEKNLLDGACQNAEIQKERPVVDVPHVQLEAVLPRQSVAPADLSEPCKARTNLVTARLPARIPIEVLRQKRARADEAHVAPEHVEQFGNFIDARLAEPATDAREPLRVGQ